MSATRLTILDAELTSDGILIKKMAVIDGESGEQLKIAAFTPELFDLIKRTEIDVTNYLAFQDLCAKNPAIKNLINTFNLTT